MKRVFVLGFLCLASGLSAMQSNNVLKGIEEAYFMRGKQVQKFRELEQRRKIKAEQRHLEGLMRAGCSLEEAKAILNPEQKS